MTTSTPKDLVVTLTTAGAPVVQPGTAFQIGADTPCGTFFLFSYFSAPDRGVAHSMQFANCGEPDPTGNDGVSLEPVVKTTGNAISYTVPFRTLPKQIKLGSSFSALTAYTAVADPVVGFGPGDFSPNDAGTEAASFDFAKGSSWKVG